MLADFFLGRLDQKQFLKAFVIVFLIQAPIVWVIAGLARAHHWPHWALVIAWIPIWTYQLGTFVLISWPRLNDIGLSVRSRWFYYPITIVLQYAAPEVLKVFGGGSMAADLLALFLSLGPLAALVLLPSKDEAPIGMLAEHAPSNRLRYASGNPQGAGFGRRGL